MRSARFATSDLDWFASVGHDENPLHLDEAYARKSSFGGRVVHGALAALTSLAALPPRSGQRLRRLVFEFPRPIFTGVDYSARVDELSETKSVLQLLDGSMLHLRGMADFAEGAVEPRPGPQFFVSTRTPARARSWNDDDLRPGVTVAVPFGIAEEAYRELEARFGLEARGVAPWQLVTLVGTSHVIGMHLPGERALFSRLELDFVAASSPREPMTFDCKVKVFDQRMNALRIAVEVRAGEVLLARGELQSFARRTTSRPIAPPQAVAPLLEGKAALVIGASRGLGASLALALAARGATVLGSFNRSTVEARALEEASRSLPGTIEMLQGDGASATWCEDAKAKLKARRSKLDFLFCNASPPLRPLWLESEARERIFDYVSQSLQLFGTPLMTFVDEVAQAGGWVVASSSIAVRQPVSDWPHYVAAKCAMEGMVHVAAKEYPAVSFLIARPPRLLTDFAPNLGSAQSALAPDRAAEVILDRLVGATAPGNVETLEHF
jgi:NAD(P)-dependent dehydrogenase (short-subunit alcohol dehydrogenase family)/acyl dehydratase